KGACESCHTVNRFVPAKFELGEHAKTKFPLEGAHRASSCRGCHPIDERLEAKIPTATKKELARRRRPERFSFALLMPPQRPELCLGCHKDVHEGQFAEAGRADTCNRCHKTTSFTDVTFDHNRSRFPLTGKHAQTPCASCHKPEKGGQMVRYKPM